jgi:hypothetical protein
MSQPIRPAQSRYAATLRRVKQYAQARSNKSRQDMVKNIAQVIMQKRRNNVTR